ncbi:MAG: hypothetical protein KJO05_00065 [Bacteroidia bacterium]|nr:hypothetical protein [Bacteroidia bacterium]NNF30903.1 hypothetical protein [Flavobacteriaceae bacterium]MBT8275391.1 hypothetical protein [Bacteroidia bacterium]NNJ81292.1 hypothetical protein [Flavobacteriaceae bacterium]NNK54516.1 hypothetical protein [Flavobacteriaceae bacterium]
MKPLYQLFVLAGLGIFAYFYFFNFDNMSETELVNSVMYWYVPLAFGLYGLIAFRIKKRMPETENNVLKYVFSGKDQVILILMILLGLSGLIGLLVLLLPLLIFNVRRPGYDLSVALVGAFLLLILLAVFFKVLWPSL